MKLGMQVALGSGHIVLDGDTARPPQSVTAPHQFSAHICCGQMAAWIKMSLGMELDLGPGDFVLDGDPALPSPNRERSPPPNFRPVYCGQMAGWMKLVLGMEVCLSPANFVLDGDPAPPQFSTHFYCGQTARCIKMQLGTEVGLSPEDFVFDGDPTPLPKRGRSYPIFGPCLMRSNGCMDQDATWYGGRPRPRRHCVRWGPSYPQKKGHTHRIQFLAHLLWPNGWMDEDATWYGSRPRPRPLCIRRVPSYPRKGHSSPSPLFVPCLFWPWLPISATAKLLSVDVNGWPRYLMP